MIDSLALGVSPSTPGTLHLLAIGGGLVVDPVEGRTVVFGRNRHAVDLCVGEGDRRVSRRHGSLTRESGAWCVRALGRVPIRLPGGRRVFRGDDPVPLAEGYTPLFLPGTRQHLLEAYVRGSSGPFPAARPDDVTQPPRTWRLSPAERLALVALGQRYLLHEAHPQPLTWQQAATLLDETQPGAGWTAKRVEHTVVAVRARLSKGGVPGLTREELGQPVGNALNHNLMLELLESTTLVPPDLHLID
ncbi:FHA domain-containing protein [Nonomuraea sediminis]|uniref:FHA domain-containing protein n=1 Tax=Nonomuraea sediminis TaxID=2835864 RepID=UPI001BDCA4B3|nr:FHA domain-containing protein [Nonomuraea sediminis]